MQTQPCELGAVLFKHIKLDSLSNIKNSLMLLMILLYYELVKVETSAIIYHMYSNILPHPFY